jgi:hypothetical protein
VQCDKTNRLAACADVQIPMLFLQGTRDTLASLDRRPSFFAKRLKLQVFGNVRATLKLFADADHGHRLLRGKPTFDLIRHFETPSMRPSGQFKIVLLFPVVLRCSPGRKKWLP